MMQIISEITLRLHIILVRSTYQEGYVTAFAPTISFRHLTATNGLANAYSNRHPE